MIDGKSIQQKLVGSDDQRAVSPVIGVILMVAITVILAAVIAAFVLDMGGSVQQEAQGAATIDVNEDAQTISVEVTSLNNADEIWVRGTADNIVEEDTSTTPNSVSYATDWDGDISNTDKVREDGGVVGLKVGDTIRLDADESGSPSPNSGTVTAVAVLNPGESDEVQTTVGSKDFDFS
ncbi:type IV pilin [Natrinema altunense]|uniref:Type IV pilin n=1 Tax=Natrinema altunense TaxID=222984 RepID=A0A482XXM3_9EURY|nr:type IV pilin N-terminal domain-containing protein [Natrinema altunense]RZH67912.1 type IV pilin [Natrinema altunense]